MGCSVNDNDEAGLIMILFVEFWGLDIAINITNGLSGPADQLAGMKAI